MLSISTLPSLPENRGLLISLSHLTSFAEGPLFVPVLGAGNIIFLPTSLISQAEEKEVNYSVDHILAVMG